MEKTWLNKQGNLSCILFFNGWGMDENAVSHLYANDFDVCMFSKYSDFEFPESEFKAYRRIYLISWSLGVWASARSLKNTSLKIEKAIAINGTLAPIDPRNGIQPRVFEMTLETWNTTSRNKFNQRMMGDRYTYQEQIHRLPQRKADEQKKELSFLQEHIKSNGIPHIKFDTVLIGRDDMIFMAKNQWNFWTSKAKVVEHNLAHYPFSGFQSWSDIIAI